MKSIYLSLIFVFISIAAFAEGTKELRPDSTSEASLLLERTNNYTHFGQYDAPSSQKIKIRIASPLEVIYLGLNNMLDGGAFFKNVGYRVVSPSGDTVHKSTTFPSPGDFGYIAYHRQAVAGPIQLGAVGGYKGIEIFPKEVGDYIIEFDPAGIISTGSSNGTRLNIKYFDVTVADENKKIKLGRLHSQGWQIATRNFGDPFNGNVYTYDGGTAVYRVNFNKMRPWVFITNFNSKGTGTGDPNNFLKDRESVPGNFTNPEYEVFLNAPDSLLYPVASKEVHLYGAIKKQSCSITEFCYSSDSPGFLDGFLDFNNNGIYERNLGEKMFGHYFSKAKDTICFPWNGKDENGIPVTNGKFKILSKFGYGVTHLPIYDVEYNENGLIVERVRPKGADRPLLFWDDNKIPETSFNGPDRRQNLSGCDNSSGCHTWTWLNGKDTKAEFDYGNNNTINTWWYSSVVFDTIDYEVPLPENVSLSFDENTLDHRDTTICQGDSMNIYVFNDGNKHFNTTLNKYEWLFNGISLPDDIRKQRQKINNNSIVTVKSTNRLSPACISYDTLRIMTVEPVKITSIVTTTCSMTPGNIAISVISNSPNARFTWKELPGINDDTLIDLKPGTYSLNVNAASIAHCGVDTSFTIPSGNGIEIDTVITQSFDCNSASGTTGTASVKMKENTKQYEYSWDKSPYNGQNEISGIGTGSHEVVVREKGTSCTDSKAFNIGFVALNYKVSKVDEVCSDKKGSITLTLPLNVDVNILWNNVANSSKEAKNLSAGNFNIKLQSPLFNLCRADTTIIISNVGATGIADFLITSPISDSFKIGEKVDFTNKSGIVKTSFWEFGDGASSSDYNASHSFASSGLQIVKLKITDSNGCPAEIVKKLFIARDNPCGLALPNAFSPNGDEVNNTIGVLGDALNIDLKIFNRWGEVIFRTQGATVINTVKWDGVYRLEDVPIGVYPFLLEYDCATDDNGVKRYKKVGDITLVR